MLGWRMTMLVPHNRWPASSAPSSLEVESVTERRRTDEGQPVSEEQIIGILRETDAKTPVEFAQLVPCLANIWSEREGLSLAKRRVP